MTEVESGLMSADKALLGALNEDISGRLKSLIPSTVLASTQIVQRRVDDVKRSVEARHQELEVAVKMSHKFDDKLRDVSSQLNDIAHNAETHCKPPCATDVDLQQHISEQKVFVDFN